MWCWPARRSICRARRPGRRAGRTRTGIDRLRSLAGTRTLAQNAAFDPGHRVEAELGYGFGVPGAPGLVTPYAGLSSGDGESRIWLVGTRWEISPDTMLAVTGTREDRGDDAPDIRLVVHGRARW